jgi:hypothetical protein
LFGRKELFGLIPLLRSSNDTPLNDKGENRTRDDLEASQKQHICGAMFFDRLVLDERLPVFNYGDTFDHKLDFEQRAFNRINDHDDGGLLDVDVRFEAW